MDNELRVSSGTTATIGYECTFEDTTKKTITIGSYRTQDISNSLVTNIKAFNSNVPADFKANLLSTTGSQFNKISGCTVTVTQRTVII